MDKNLKGWNKTDEVLRKDFLFENFKQAVDFVNKVAEISEREEHHPDINIHDYNKVTISLTTHSEGKVTEKDFDLAVQIDSCQN